MAGSKTEKAEGGIRDDGRAGKGGGDGGPNSDGGSNGNDGGNHGGNGNGNSGGGADGNPGGNDNSGGKGNPGGDGGLTPASVAITVVVNGAPTLVHAMPSDTLGDVRKQALNQTNNIAQPPENWELKNEEGEVLDADKKVGSRHFGPSVTLFLSLSAGVAGE